MVFIYKTFHPLYEDRHSYCYRVSSVLNRDVKQFGKKYMFDNEEETCWNSDQVH